MREWTPRRCSKRWLDGDCPDGVLAIFDNKGSSSDRYTVMYAETYKADWPGAETYVWGRNMSSNPSHPQGIGMSFEMKLWEAARYRYRFKHHYATWTSLPQAVKDCVRRDLAPENHDGALETAA